MKKEDGFESVPDSLLKIRILRPEILYIFGCIQKPFQMMASRTAGNTVCEICQTVSIPDPGGRQNHIWHSIDVHGMSGG